MRKGELCFVLLFLVLFYWPNLAHSHTDSFPIDSIGRITDLVLEQRGDKADVYFPNIDAAEDAFLVVAVLQGAGVDKSLYDDFPESPGFAGFGTQPALLLWVLPAPKRAASGRFLRHE